MSNSILRRVFFIPILLTSFISFGQGDYDTNSVMVRFNHQLLNNQKLDNWDLSYFALEKMLTDEGKAELTELGSELFNIGHLECRKIFPDLKSYNTVSIGRQGQEVSIPPFWATFSVNRPTNVGFLDFTRTLKSAYPLVIYLDPKFEIELLSVPNDSMYVQQQSLASTTYPDGHINVEEAWEVETGVPWIKVGVFDTGIDTTNEDLDVLTGWAYNGPYAPVWGTDDRNHGTKGAGVIGARRNNDLGIAGIAGGDGSDSTGISLIDFRYNQGGGDVSDIEQLSVGIINAARSVGTYYDWGQNQQFDLYTGLQAGYGIHIGNHSYGVKVDASNKQEDAPQDTLGGGGTYGLGGEFDDCNLCRESFLFSLQNGVVNVVSRGNVISLPPNPPSPNLVETINKYPASYDDSWIISVGSSGTDGNRLLPGVNATDYYFHPKGKNIDVIAPGTVDLVWTTSSVQDTSGSNPNPQPYGKYNGTSAAAPHVSGVAALLLSHYNDTCYSELNLDPADVEYIIQKSAKPTIDNTFTNPYSIASGWGRLDAEKAIGMIDFPEYQIIHPTTSFINSQIIEQDTITLFVDRPLNQPSFGPLGSSFSIQLERNYRTVRYKYSINYNFSQFMGDSAELLDTWVRHSQTNSLRKIEDAYDSLVPISPNNPVVDTVLFTNTFEIEPMCKIDSIVGDSSIYLSGYYYHFTGKYGFGLDQGISDTENFWYPIDPISETPEMAYSIYVRDTTIAERYPFTCDSLNALFDSTAHLNNIFLNDNFIWELYPNPSNSSITVTLGDEVPIGWIVLTDISGKEINRIRSTGDETHTIDISQFGNGLYFVNLIDSHGNFLESKKLMKQ